MTYDVSIETRLGIDDDSDVTSAAAEIRVRVFDDNDLVVGTAHAVLFDPYAPDSRGMHEEGDAISSDCEAVAGIVYNSDGDFNAWWSDACIDIEMALGRVLFITSVAIDEKHRGAGLALLVLRRLIMLMESNLVVLFLPAGSVEDTFRLERYYKQLGFRRVPKLSCTEESYKLARKCKLMFLDTAKRHRSTEYGWSPRPSSRPARTEHVDETLH